MKTETPEMKLLREEISKRTKIIRKIEEKINGIRKRIDPYESTKRRLPNIKKCDPSLDLSKVRSFLNKKIKKQRKRMEILQKDLNKKGKIYRWLDYGVRLAKEECGYKSIEKKELAILVGEFKSLTLKAGEYATIKKFDHLKYPGIKFTKSGRRYKKTWIFLITKSDVEMYYRVEDEPAEGDEEHICHPYAKELKDASPTMVEVLKKMDEILQKNNQ